jgi:hypothetical protein
MLLAHRQKIQKSKMEKNSELFNLVAKDGKPLTLVAIPHFEKFKKKQFAGTQVLTLTVYGDLLEKVIYEGATYKNRVVSELLHVDETTNRLILTPVKSQGKTHGQYGF